MKTLKSQTELRAYCRYENATHHLHRIMIKNNPTREEFDKAYTEWRESANEYQGLVDRIKETER